MSRSVVARRSSIALASLSAAVAGLTLGLAGLAFAPTKASAASGSDGGYGYTWRDSLSGATYALAVPDTVTIRNPPNNVGPLVPVGMGIVGGFTFYGVTYTTCYVSDNGWISFDAPNALDPTAPVGPCTLPGSTPLPTAVVAPFWKDIDSSTAGTYFNYYGRIAADNAWMAAWNGLDTVTGLDAAFELILFPDGRIKFQYRRDHPTTGVTIGLAGNPPPPSAFASCQIAACDVVAPGVAITTATGPYAIEFRPAGILNGECALIPSQACGVVSDSLPGTLPGNVLFYGCSGTRYSARERVYAVTLATTSVIDVNLSGDPNQVFFIMDSCNEWTCFAGPLRATSLALAAGTYYIAVDAPAVAQEGPFTISIACSALGTPITCNSTVSASTFGGQSLFGSYPSCTGTGIYGDTERIYAITTGAGTNLRARLNTGSAALDVFILHHTGGGAVTGNDCVAWGDQQAVVWDATPGTYLIVVDSALGAAGPFELLVSCTAGIDCTTTAGTIDFSGAPVQTIRGDNSGGTSQTPLYSCDPAGSYEASEDIWVVTLPTDGQVTVYPISGGQSYFLLSSCSEGDCVGSDRCSTVLPAGTYYLVVDHPTAGAPYEAMVFLESPPFPRWSDCERPFGSTQQTDTVRNFWNFDDGAFCISDTASYNYDRNGDGIGPDGCVFAMYASVRCGTSLHLPFWDCESGHVRIFDLMQGQYVNLTAQSLTGWFQSGTDIQWDDPLCNGADPLHNETITDVYFDRPAGLCGIFRLEFPNHSGFVWELYANCDGGRTPVFDIYDSLCGALGTYTPLPNLSLLSASGVYNCPDVTVTYTIKNDGCGPATNFPVELYDDFRLVTTNVVPYIESGETLTIVFTATIGITTGAITLQADSTDLVTECTEVPGAGCDPLVGVEQISLPPCDGTCQIVAQAIVTPPTMCVGQSVDIDASTSSSVFCTGRLEYQLRGPTGTIPFGFNPLFTGISPLTTANYDIDVRCETDTTCTNTRTVNIPVERPPTFPAASVQAVDLAACNLGIVVSWSPATFHGTAGSGSYNIYRASTDVNGDTVVDCADALASTPTVNVTSPYPDTNTVSGTTYFYVVEAEDGTPNTTCVPAGPRNRGAATRVDVSGGICTGITDLFSTATDLLPKVGGTLLAGGDYGDGSRRYGETFVEFTWGVDRPLDLLLDEHFHFQRSAQPDGGWVRLTTEPPLLQFLGYTDFGADHPNDGQTYCWYYLTFVADSCDNENTSSDGGDGGPP